MASRKGNDYFEMLSELVDYSCSAANLLHDTLLNFDVNEMKNKIGKCIILNMQQT